MILPLIQLAYMLDMANNTHSVFIPESSHFRVWAQAEVQLVL